MNKFISKVNMFRGEDNPFFGSSVTEVSLDDEAGGIFIRVTQNYDEAKSEIRLDLDEVDMFCEILQNLKTIGEGIPSAEI